MNTSRWTRTGAIGATLLVCSWITFAQTSKKTTTTTAVAKPALLQRVETRRNVLDLQERKRLEILNDLEFTPRPRPLGFPFPGFCFLPPPTPAAAIDPHRSLFVHDRATLDAADFSLNRTLTEIANDVVAFVPGTTSVSIFKQLWDTQAVAPGLVPSSPHCSDNGSTINGFPINCPRGESDEASGTNAQILRRMNEYFPLALVNRLDLAHSGWRNCGEYRIVYGRRGDPRGKNLIIFEAVLPNPKPGCREGCLPVAQFWRNLSTVDSAATRANRLVDFFYNGLPGFRPVVHANHYSASGVSTGYGSSGSGQIRTNQFLESPWMLKEFKTVLDCGTTPCTFNLVPIMVKVNPQGTLWNEDDPNPLGANFRADTVAQLTRLSDPNMMKIGYEVALAHDAGQSISQAPAPIDQYRDQMNSAATVGFRAALGAGSLSADQIANRATTQSCAGCHQPSTFGLNAPDSIGTTNTPPGSPVPTVDSWPPSVPAGFVHVDVRPSVVLPELAANPAAFGTGEGQVISQALLDFFLPDRKNFLLGQLNAARCRCIPRFKFLPIAKQKIAFDIEARVNKQFAERLAALEQRQMEVQMDPKSAREGIVPLAREQEALIEEREATLVSELRKADIVLLETEKPDLRAQPMKLRAGADAKARVKEINDLLKEEPPRRTVTGSFRAH